MTDAQMIETYKQFKKGKTNAEFAPIRHEMMVSYDKGSMSHFCAFLAEKYQTAFADALAIYKCLYHETWIRDLKND
jgi:hypothetical protein